MSVAAHVLFLDVDFQPLRVAPLRRAMTKIATGKVEVVRFSADGTIRLVGEERPAPSVVRVLRRFRRDKVRVRFSRLNIYTRDAFTCQYCGDRFPYAGLTFEHVLPRSRGGRTCWENIVTACVPCNTRKADRTPAEAGMRLLALPRKPFALPALTSKIDPTQMPVEWADYWTAALEA
jgi:5-methylcytosine-specific restriction endonuclease McrA